MHRASVPAKTDTALVDALQNPQAFSHPADDIALVETHISWLILAGDFAYKIKKPITLDFLDFGELRKRRFYCEEEIRLNKPWAPEIYVDVVAISLEDGRPRFGGTGEPIEYAVRMRRFDQQSRLDRQLEQGKLSAGDMRELAEHIARRHLEATVAAVADRAHIVDRTKAFIRENFPPLEALLGPAELRFLRDWTECELLKVDELLWQRFDAGFVRECHGDLHLGNLVRLGRGITTFDCIEFNPDLYRIDVVCDIAFLVMDLVARERHDLAAGFLNRYLERTGDYGGVELLDLYFVYRCLVRAKVAAILRAEHESQADKASDLAEARRYCAMAKRQIAKPPPVLIVMSGLSGSGKTWVSTRLMAALPAIRLRSDIERKRLFDLRETEDSASGVCEGIYTPESTGTVYRHLNDAARRILNAGHNVILDAAFLDAGQRRQAIRSAVETGYPWILVKVEAPERVLRDRIALRAESAGDASEARADVLEHQIASATPFDDKEMKQAIVCDNSAGVDIAALVEDIKDLLHRS